MSDPFIKDGDESEPKIPAGKIEPHVTSWRTGKLILVLVLILAIGLAFSGVGTVIAITIGHDNSNKIDSRSKARDAQTRELITQLKIQQTQIKTLTTKVAANQAKNTAVLCQAVLSGIQTQVKAGTPPPGLHQTLVFARNYGCMIPPDLAGK